MQEQSKDFNDFRKQEIKEAKFFWDKILSLDFPDLFDKEPKETKIKGHEEIHMVEAKSGLLCANCDHEEYYHKDDSGVTRRCTRFGENIYVNKSTDACRCEDYKLKDLQNVVFDKNGNKHIE